MCLSSPLHLAPLRSLASPPRDQHSKVRRAPSSQRDLHLLPAPAGCSTKCLEGETSKTKRAVRSRAAAAGGGIESLPDGVLQHILGFLQSEEAVRTCVLARRWRHLWKSATGLRVGVGIWDPRLWVSVEDLRSLTNHLLLLRGGAPLDACYFTFKHHLSNHDDVPHVNLWFRHVIMCKVRDLRLYIFGHSPGETWAELYNRPLISKHLARLQLVGVMLHNSLLNFSSCPALEHLELADCELSSVKEIVSESLKYFSVFDLVCSDDHRIRIDTPNLLSLSFHSLERTPLLEKMPSLLKATVSIPFGCWDHCTNANYETCDCESCDTFDSMASGNKNGLVLKGLSEAKCLELISAPHMRFIRHKFVTKLRVIPMKKSVIISEQLKLVEFKCDVLDDRVLKVMKFLCAFNIGFSVEEMETLEG
nr:unnamed protein product [Digitaria exilis]